MANTLLRSTRTAAVRLIAESCCFAAVADDNNYFVCVVKNIITLYLASVHFVVNTVINNNTTIFQRTPIEEEERINRG